MRKKRQEFMDLKQGGWFVHDYLKLFNHLKQGGWFVHDYMVEFVSNVIIADDAIHAHKEAKKRKAVAAPSGSAPPRYRTVYHHSPTYPPCQH
jgi:hypothetical protein